MKLSPDAMQALDAATCKGNVLDLSTAGQLDRKLYVEVNKAIEAAGGKWQKGKKVHLFPDDAAEAMEAIMLTGIVIDPKKLHQQFYTSIPLAGQIADMAGIEPGMLVLEPSAGQGALAKAARLRGANVVCIEIDPKNVKELQRLNFEPVEADFLGENAAPVVDRVVMNPPFTRGQDVAHVTHALRFLKPGGRLVAIVSASVLFRKDPRFKVFRGMVEAHDGTIAPLPPGSFKEAGTEVNTCVVTIG